jgi:tetratricopeptide (TPR) repeat protein
MDWDRFNELVELSYAGRFDEVVAELTGLADAETDPPTKAAIMLAVANGFTDQRRFSDARRKLHQATATISSKHPSYPRLLLAVAVIDIHEENWKAALKKLGKIIEKYDGVLKIDDNADVFEEIQRNRGIALFELNRVREALPLLQSVRKIEYQKERTLYSIAASNIALKDYDAALLDFRELLSLNPNSIYRSYAHYNMGRIYYDRRQLARGKSEFENCLACPDRGNLSDRDLLQALVYSCRGLNLESDASRYSQMLKTGQLER